ncbi:MAG: ABC transporter ATP-binding protein, partial [Chloroflexia bacterium]
MAQIEKARDPRWTFLRLLRYLSPYRLGLALVLLLVLVSTFLGLVGPYLMGRAIDRFIGNRDAVGLVRLALWMLGVFVLGNLADALSGWRMAGISQRALQRLRRDLFNHLQGLPLRFFDSRPAGELMSRLTNDIEAINQAVSQNAIGLLGSSLSLVGTVVAMFVLNHWLALASVVVVPLMFWFTTWLARYTRKGFRELQKHLGELNGVLEESISGLRVLKAFRRSEAAIQDFEGENEEVYRAGVYANSYALLLMPLTNQLGNLFVIAIAGLGGWLALRHLASVGTIVAFISYARAFVNPLRQISNIYNAIQAALAGAERIFEVLDTPPEPPDPPDALPLEAVQGEVRFEGVTFGYLPDRPVIRNVSLEARPGQTVALV